MLRIILIRPGSTDYVEQARVHGTLDIPLSERGTEEVARTGEELRDLGIRAVFCSDAEPALSTAKALATVLDVRAQGRGAGHVGRGNQTQAPEGLPSVAREPRQCLPAIGRNIE